MRFALATAVLLLTGGCVEPQQKASPVIDCTSPRPQVCTMEYAPVCAQLAAGGSKLYSSACNACADDAVAGYLPGPCPE